jgi:hypothetical protein
MNTSHTGGYHLVGVLQVMRLVGSHEKAAAIYEAAGIALPSNCMVEGNPSFDFDQTIGPPDDFGSRFREAVTTGNTVRANALLKAWDKEYWEIAHAEDKPKLRRVAFTKPLYVNTVDPKPVFRELLDSIFGKNKPGTQNSAAWPITKINELLVALGLVAIH